MKAVVLVGGEGTRLRPLTFTTPKPLLPIANQPFLERQLLALADHGVDEVVLSMGYLPDAFHEHFRDESGQDTFRGMRLRYAVEKEPLGTAGAIRFAADGIDERFVVCNGDVLTRLDLTAMVEFHDARGAEVTISLTRVDDPSAFGVVPTDDDGAVISFVEKPPSGSAPSNWINAGTYVIEPPFLDRIPPRLNVSVERETFPRLLEQSGRLFGYKTDAYWLDIGTPEKYLEAHLDVLRGFVGRPPAPGARLLSEDVWTQGDATIEPGATILAPALDRPGRPRAVRRAGARVGARSRRDRRAGCGAGDRSAPRRGPHLARLHGRPLRRRPEHRGEAGRDAHRTHDRRRRRDGPVGNADLGGSLPIGARVASPDHDRPDTMKAMVTGGAGFIGSTLVDRLLAEGWRVDAVDDLSTGSLANLANARAQPDRQFSFHRIDVSSPAFVDLVAHRRPEVLFHLAAQADVRVSVARPVFDATVNIIGTLNACEGALAAGTSKVVFAASGGTLYGDTDELPIREGQPQLPESPYGVAKKAACDYLYYFRKVRGLESTALALANVYGPRQDPHGEAGVVSIFAGKLLSRERPVIYGDGSQTRDFVYVDDVVDAFVRAVDKGGGLVMNIGTGVETSVQQLFDVMARLTGFKQDARYDPPRAGELMRSALDPSRAGIHLGWQPWTNLDEGVARTLEHFKGQLAGSR